MCELSSNFKQANSYNIEKQMYLDQYGVHEILQILIKTNKTGLS